MKRFVTVRYDVYRRHESGPWAKYRSIVAKPGEEAVALKKATDAMYDLCIPLTEVKIERVEREVIEMMELHPHKPKQMSLL